VTLMSLWSLSRLLAPPIDMVLVLREA
jgi:hypothetical protein